MPLYNYTVADAIAAAGTSTGITASIITQILGDVSKAKSHADAHMKGEDFWTTKRTVGSRTGVGDTVAVDEHLKAAYKKRTEHSMFDSPVSSVEATTAALNCSLGVLALSTLLGNSDDDGVDLYSRTAVATVGSTKQIVRTKDASGVATMVKGDAEYVVVCLRKSGNILVVASAYPVMSDASTRLEHAGKDWYQSQKTKAVIRELPSVSPPVVNW